jgi:hypothetical protein
VLNKLWLNPLLPFATGVNGGCPPPIAVLLAGVGAICWTLPDGWSLPLPAIMGVMFLGSCSFIVFVLWKVTIWLFGLVGLVFV